MGKSISVGDSMGPFCNGLSISLTSAANGKFVAVTGADSFIGSHIVKILLGKGYMVRGTVQDVDLANFLTELPKAAALSLFKAELRDEVAFDKVFEGCDCVFHVASPTLMDQREMKSPETEMIDDAVLGTENVLKSCKKAGVKAVVLTSSMCAASPGPYRPKMINESHWSVSKLQKEKGHYYNASKTSAERHAVDFVAKMPTESAFRLVRICPTFTVGPMLQPTVNSSMYRFAAICDGFHHKQIPNGSRSLIDVRDTAAHHVAAYEKGLEGRFFSTSEAWPWTLIYQALKFYRPLMNCPVPLPLGVNPQPVREYNKTRMNVLGVKERSLMQTLGDAVKECEQKNLTSGSPSILNVAGYYDLGSGNGQFLMVDVQCIFQPNQPVSNQLRISYVTEEDQLTPTITPILNGSLSQVQNSGEFKLKVADMDMDLTFQIMTENIHVTGSINGTEISGKSFITYVPYQAFAGVYTTEDDSDSVTFALGGMGNNSITFSDGLSVGKFIYDPVKRKFQFDDKGFTKRLYMNVAADKATGVGPGSGIIIRFVQFETDSPKGKKTSSTKVYLLNTKPVIEADGSTIGANSLGTTFGGYYPLNVAGSFVSISQHIGAKASVEVGVSINGISTQYPAFSFQQNMLSFPESDAPTLKFTENTTSTSRADVTVFPSDGGESLVGQSYFSVAPLEAFGFRELIGKYSTGTSETTLSISQTDGPLPQISFTMDGNPVFTNITEYSYNPVEQDVVYDDYRLNFCYNLRNGVTCGVTRTNVAHFNTVLFAYPSV